MPVAMLLLLGLARWTAADFVALSPADYRQYFVEGWPGPHDDGSGAGVVNQSSYEWAVENLPLFDSSDTDFNQAYYYRAKSYKSHMMRTDWVDIKHVSSEFGPSVPWGGVYGTINAAAGHHITEGRWIRDRDYTAGLVRFWIGSQSQQVCPEALTHCSCRKNSACVYCGRHRVCDLCVATGRVQSPPRRCLRAWGWPLCQWYERANRSLCLLILDPERFHQGRRCARGLCTWKRLQGAPRRDG